MSSSFISTTILPTNTPPPSTTLADAVVDAVILLAYVAVERHLTRRLRNAGPRASLASKRQIVLIEKLPGAGLLNSGATLTAATLAIGHGR
jgi:hypothetical protein